MFQRAGMRVIVEEKEERVHGARRQGKKNVNPRCTPKASHEVFPRVYKNCVN